jgi:uncharacterized membrane protein
MEIYFNWSYKPKNNPMFGKKKKEFFFNEAEEHKIIDAIRKAEDHTSGEIRVHVEPECKGDSFQRAIELFAELEMHRTQLHNGVLFYLAYESHKFSIVADEGINKAVPENFWEEIKDMMQSKFKDKDFVLGLTEGIALTGQQLKTYFPIDEEADQNELSDDISKS